jgi:predicted MPP superfamily phosphohydrolase
VRSFFLSSLVAIIFLIALRVVWPLRDLAFVFWPVLVACLGGIGALLWLPLVYWRSSSPGVTRLEVRIEKIAHISMGAVSFLLVCEGAREIAGIFLPSARGAHGSLAVIVGTTVLFFAGYLTARFGPFVRRVPVELDLALPPAFRLRIVQISDLHVGTWIRRAYVERVAKRITDLGPIDLLLLTGDIGDGDPANHRADLEPLLEIRPTLGAFSVSGNHEGYWNEAGWNREIGRLGVRILENDSVALVKDHVPIRVLGVSDSRPNLAKAASQAVDREISILLAHQPKHAERAAEFPIRIALSGHTHAGQFLPWSWIIGFFHRFPKGLYREGKLTVYVNSGTGYWGPPLRLGTLSEITLLEVTSHSGSPITS